MYPIICSGELNEAQASSEASTSLSEKEKEKKDEHNRNMKVRQKGSPTSNRSSFFNFTDPRVHSA